MSIPNQPDKSPNRGPERPEQDRDPVDDTPDTPPTEPDPVPVEEPPRAPGDRGPYIVE